MVLEALMCTIADCLSLGCGSHGLPVVAQQFAQPADRVRRDAREHVVEPGKRLDAAPLAANGPPPVDPVRRQRAWLSSAIVGGAILLGAFGWWTWRFQSPVTVAVLPFENLNHDSADAYLADGLSGRGKGARTRPAVGGSARRHGDGVGSRWQLGEGGAELPARDPTQSEPLGRLR